MLSDYCANAKCTAGYSGQQPLSVITKEKQSYGTGAGMGTDGSAYGVHHNVGYAEFLFHKLCHIRGVFLTVPVTDHDHLILASVSADPLLHHGDQRCQGFLPSSHLSHRYQLALIIHVEHGLDICQCPQNCCGFGDTSAPVEMIQVIHSEDVAGMKNVLPDPLYYFLHGPALCLHLRGIPYKQAFPHGRSQGVNHLYPSVRVRLPELLRGNTTAVVCSAEAG